MKSQKGEAKVVHHLNEQNYVNEINLKIKLNKLIQESNFNNHFVYKYYIFS